MKRLTRIKLIHWHYFVNETISLRGSTLLTGENGTGKSTILDAIQFALVGDQRKVRFNVSAHEETRRDLRGYLRGKTGSDTDGDSTGSLREGQDFTSYVALEFYDTQGQECFVVGTVIDSYASGDMDTCFFKIDNKALDEDDFFVGARPRNIAEFRHDVCGKTGARLYKTAETYRKDLKTKLGHLSDRFFTLLVKALAFKPITNIRDFVYYYLLEEQSVNIEAMRQNLQHYREFETLVAHTKKKVEQLEAISGQHRSYLDYGERIRVQSYVILRADHEHILQQLGLARGKVEGLTESLSKCRKTLSCLKDREPGVEQRIYDIRDTINDHSAHQIITRLEGEINDVSFQLVKARQQLDVLKGLTSEEEANLEGLKGLLGQAETWLGPQEQRQRYLEDLRVSLSRLTSVEGDVADLEEDLHLLALEYRETQDMALGKRESLRIERNSLNREVLQLESDLRTLAGRQRVYDPALLRLQGAISEEVFLGGGPIEPRVFCELLEIPNELWQNAVEGYLNTQRFDLLVPPDAFDAALSVYERRKVKDKISKVGLVNGSKILDDARPALRGSLAEEVQASDPIARAYADRLLGTVMKCRDEQGLKHHKVAITPTCMTYRNHVARQINFKVYETWYIGERAFERQIELKKRRLGEVQGELEVLALQLKTLEDIISHSRDKTDRFDRLLSLREEAQSIPSLEALLKEKRSELERIDRRELEDLENHLRLAEREKEELRRQVERHTAEEGSLTEKLSQAQQGLAGLSREAEEKEEVLETYVQDHQDVVAEGIRRWDEAVRANDARTIKGNFERSRKQAETLERTAWEDLFQLRSNYNREYYFGAVPSSHDNDAYDNELQKLVESELPEYEERIAAARQGAEEEFKEHFVYKLREYIEVARSQFNDLNLVLGQIHFGQDRYRFQIQKSAEFGHFYDMITDETLMQGHSLFSEDFQDKHRASIEQLFGEILDVSEEEQARNIDKFTDYRTYLDYDIKIHHDNGEVSSFSKVAREKSGGESQTPYYVAIVASFLHLYRAQHKKNTVRLMMFDEAFNRMDVDRIERALEFIGQLDLQLICAAPTDKAEVITPYMSTTLLVIRNGHRTWLQDYHQFMSETALLEVAASEDRS